MMAKDFSLFIVTEGVRTDPFFYDKIAATSPDKRVRSVKTYTVSQITRGADGKPGPAGKSPVIAAYHSTRRNRGLSYVNSGGRRSIVFCVDRDVDLKHVDIEDEMHFCVTSLRDAEAELFANADLTTAIQHLLSVDSADARRRAQPIRNWIDRLALVWSDWILLGAVVAQATTVPTGSWAGGSIINAPRHGPVDEALKSLHEGRVQSALGSQRKLLRAKRDARALLREMRSRTGPRGLVKGKWLPGWLANELATTSAETAIIQRDALLAFSGSLDYEANWADHYRAKFAEAMTRARRPA